MTTSLSHEQKDEALWMLAKKRAGFKRHLVTYIIVNVFLWAVWVLSPHFNNYTIRFPWPLWTTLGWGIGLTFHFAGTYLFPEHEQAEIEYQKLKNKQL